MTNDQLTADAITATVHERGNGLPDIGDYVAGDDGEVYRIIGLTGPIHTGSAGEGNYMFASLEPADWSDISDDNEPTCSATLEAKL